MVEKDTEEGSLDFCIIGAPRSGTTSLFHYLNSHPNIHIPARKELKFFHRDKYFNGRTWLFEEFFQDADPDSLWGDASVGSMKHPETAERISEMFPDIRLIAVLRDPVERAFSQYLYWREMKQCSTSFSRIVDCFLNEERDRSSWTNLEQEGVKKLRVSEYGRILSRYLQHFSRDQILILFTEHLREQPEQVMARTCSFLDLDEQYDRSLLDRKFHRGGSRRFQWLKSPFRLIRSLIKRISKPAARQFWNWFKWEFSIDHSEKPSMEAHLRTRLRRYYLKDVQQLQENMDVSIPWEWFHEEQGIGSARKHTEQ